MSDQTTELFFEKQRRIERELAETIKLLGERDCEIARLRESLQAVAVMCPAGHHCQKIRDVRERALQGLRKAEQAGTRE